MNNQEMPIAHLRPEWRRCDVEGGPVRLDAARGYARWIEVTGRVRNESLEPFYGLGRSFPTWASSSAFAYQVRPRGSPARHLPFEPAILALDVAGVGQIPTTRSQVVALARSRRGCFLSREVAAGAAFDALLSGLLPSEGSPCVAALVTRVDLADPEVIGAAEEGEHIAVCHWSFDGREPDLGRRLAGASCQESRLFLAESEIGWSPPDLVILPL